MTKLISIVALFSLVSLLAFAETPKAPQGVKEEAAAPAAKAPLLSRFEKTCLQNSAAEGRSQKDLCGCLKTNLGAKLSPEQLSLLVRFYEGEAAAKASVQKPENAPLLDFDMEAADQCLNDPKWRAAAGPRAPDVDENAGTEIVEEEKIKETLKTKPSADGAEALAKTQQKAAKKQAAPKGAKPSAGAKSAPQHSK